MKVLSALLLCMICFSCSDTDSKTNELHQRVTRLEQRMDSLTNTQNENAITDIDKRTISTDDRCQGVTKKGAQCKRKAKANGYCWQHGG